MSAVSSLERALSRIPSGLLAAPATSAMARSGADVSMTRSGMECSNSSARVPWKIIRPSARMPSTPAIFSISSRRWLETITVMPWPARSMRRERTSSMPAGSSPLVGSSRTSSEGSRARAMAIPSRCFIPSEYRRTSLSRCCVSRTVANARSTWASASPSMSRTIRMFSHPVRWP
ncbi:hypothetical protein CMMCA002_10660 [Clavibacter michiganensis subsp. michiganensis]|nr:hypothetical protein CMMCAS06_03380 [Clavibacter michiganensis subsp. michiganensis]OUE16605.1 hypothetical protein CMMCA002_10660 [Clavibacter michiganensis subsp. michiganensis]